MYYFLSFFLLASVLCLDLCCLYLYAVLFLLLATWLLAQNINKKNNWIIIIIIIIILNLWITEYLCKLLISLNFVGRMEFLWEAFPQPSPSPSYKFSSYFRKGASREFSPSDAEWSSLFLFAACACISLLALAPLSIRLLPRVFDFHFHSASL